MAWRTEEFRTRYLPLLLAFLAGIVGGLIIGWGLWPVKWSNALPVDLRADMRDQYLLMTAESYAANSDADLARQRLQYWPESQLTEDLSNLQFRLQSSDPTQAVAVEQLAAALGAPAGPAPAPAAAGRSSLSKVVQQVCTGALWAVLVLVGLLAIALLWRRWRAAQAGEPTPAIDTMSFGQQEPFGRRAPSAQPGPGDSGWREEELDNADLADAGERPMWGPVSEGPDGIRQAGEAREEPQGTVSPVAPDSAPVPPKPSPAGEPTTSGYEPTWRPPAAPRPAPAGTPVKIGEFMAAYHAGEPDYDEAFDIHDAASQYVGQCGLGLTSPVGRSNDQAAALQVWLWDTNDPDTQVKVLVSEGAYRDTALRDQLAGEHPAVQVRPRVEFELETYNLLLRGVVESVEYADQEPPNGIFSELVVRLRAYKKTSA